MKTRKAGSNSGDVGKSLSGVEHCKYHREDFSQLNQKANTKPLLTEIELKELIKKRKTQ